MPLTLTFTGANVSNTGPFFHLTNSGTEAGFAFPTDGITDFAFSPNGSFDFKALTFNLSQMNFTVDSAAIFDGQISLVLQVLNTTNTTGVVQPVLTMSGFAADTVTAEWNSNSLGDTQQPLYPGRPLKLTDYVLP
jgi:hypothetical protein